MKREYIVTRQRGVAGVDEQEIERKTVIAKTPKEAIRLCVTHPFNPVNDWPVVGTDQEPICENPNTSQGGSGRFNDYYMVEPSIDGVEESVIAQNPDDYADRYARLPETVKAQY